MTLGGTNITIDATAFNDKDTEEVDLYLSAGKMAVAIHGQKVAQVGLLNQ